MLVRWFWPAWRLPRSLWRRTPRSAPAPAPAKKAMFWKVSSGRQRGLSARVDSSRVEETCIPCRRRSRMPSTARRCCWWRSTSITSICRRCRCWSFKPDVCRRRYAVESRQPGRSGNAWRRSARSTGFQATAMAKMKPWVVAMMVSTIPLVKKRQGGRPRNRQILSGQGGKGQRSGWWRSSRPKSLMKLVSGITAEDAGEIPGGFGGPGSRGIRQADFRRPGSAAMPASWTGSLRKPMSKTRLNLPRRCWRTATCIWPMWRSSSSRGKEPAFVVVGAGHMVGPDGVVQLLEKRGYKVEQVAIWSR